MRTKSAVPAAWCIAKLWQEAYHSWTVKYGLPGRSMPDLHPVASEHLPWFLTAPGDTDILMVITTIVVIATVFGLGIVFFKLHSLPERLGHTKLQFETVAVLGLLSLFTHIHAFWVAGLLLALIDIPDFQTPLRRIAGSLERMSGTGPPPATEAAAKPHSAPAHGEPGA
jgi:hypothetical protein